MGLPAPEARLKIAFGAPEVLAATVQARAADIAESLISAGMNVSVRSADELGRIPWPTLASSFEFGSTALAASTLEGRIEIPYDRPVFAVACRPPADFRAPDQADATGAEGREAAEAMEWVTHIDFYHVRDGELARLSIAPELTRGWAGRGATGTAADLMALLVECRRHFKKIEIDGRLDGVRPRRRFVAGETGFDPDVRRRYAFGTLLLRHLLEEISPALRDATHYETGSRLAYVLQPSRGTLRVG
jgi:hypothetical protein